MKNRIATYMQRTKEGITFFFLKPVEPTAPKCLEARTHGFKKRTGHFCG